MYSKFSKAAILVIILISAVSFFPLRDLKFEVNLDRLFSVNDPDLDYFNDYKERFHSEIDDEYIFIGLTNQQGIFDKKFLNKVDTLTKFIFEFDSIISVYSITNTYYYYFKNRMLTKDPVVHYLNPELYKADSIKLSTSKEFNGFLISKDGKSVIISAFNTPSLSEKGKVDLLERIKSKIDQLGFNKSYFTAKILVEETYAQETKRNLILYLSISIFLVCLVLLLLFRSLKAILAPLATVVFSICWTLALISFFGYPLDIISSMLPPVLAVICVSDIVHISTKYIEELRNGKQKLEALKSTFRDIGLATFYTSFTTAVGFFSLCISNIIPIRLFGLFAGVGVLLAFIIVIVFIFGIYVNSPVPKIVQFQLYQQRWTNLLSASFRKLIRSRYWVIGTTACLLIISIYFINKIQINSSLLQEIPKDNPILKDYNFIETQFSGTRPFEMALILKDSNTSFLDIEIIREIEEVNTFLKDSCNVGMLISHLSFIKNARKAFDGGVASGYDIPVSEADVYFLCNKIMQSEWGGEMIRFMTMDKKHARISGKIPDLTTIEFKALSTKFDNYFKTKKDFHFNYKMTGSGVLLDKTTYSLTKNMLWGLFIAFCVISLIVGFMFRSFRMVVIALVANLIPLVFTAAVMGMLGIYLKADTSIIFAISFGIIVDDTIHYLSKIKIELSKGRSTAYAVKRAYLTTGKAMIITTLILLAGFGTLLFSSFGGVYYVGLLMSLSLIFALIADLSILPLMILKFYRNPNDPKNSSASQ